MKKDNKKALYESIMTSVAKEVKKALNEGILNEEFNNSIIKDAIENKNFDNATIHIYNDGKLFYNGFLSNFYTKQKNSFLIIHNDYFVSDSLTSFENYKDFSKFIDKIERKSKNGKYSGYIGIAYNKKPRRTDLLYYEYIELTEDGAKQLKDIIIKQDNRRDNKYEYSEDTYKQDTTRRLNTLKSERYYEIQKRERDAEIAKYKDLLDKLGIDPSDEQESMIAIHRLQSVARQLLLISPNFRKLLHNKDINQKFEDKLKEDLLEILDEE